MNYEVYITEIPRTEPVHPYKIQKTSKQFQCSCGESTKIQILKWVSITFLSPSEYELCLQMIVAMKGNFKIPYSDIICHMNFWFHCIRSLSNRRRSNGLDQNFVVSTIFLHLVYKKNIKM